MHSVFSFSLRQYIKEDGHQIKWEETGSPIYPYQTKINEQPVKLRINGEWPEKPLYTVIDENGLDVVDVEAIREEGGFWMLSSENYKKNSP